MQLNGLVVASVLAAVLLAQTSAFASTTVPEAKKPTLLVFDLVAERGLDEGLTRLLNEVLLTEFSSTGVYEVVGGSDLVAMLDAEAKRQLAGCDDTECLAAIGGALGAQYLATASVGRVGDGFLLNVKLLDARGGTVLKRSSQDVDGDEQELLSAVRRGVTIVVGDTSKTSASRDSGPKWPWLVGGGGAAALAAGAVLLAIRNGESSIRANEYADYLAAQPADRDQRYGDVRDAVQRHNTLTAGGAVLIGVGVSALAVSVVGGLMSRDAPAASLSVTSGSASLHLGWEF